MSKQKYQLEKLANRKTDYPLATVAYYGPEDLFAPKLVVGILASEKDGDLVNMRKWFSPDLDVRQDLRIFQEMLDFIDENQPRRIAMVNRIIGCPHEEGIDYPDGEVCPQCPYWANRDRWTGELLL